MKKDWDLNPEAFDKMLFWLDEDREIAGRKYEAIRLRLIKILNYRGCFQAEELADEVFDRVNRKIDEITKNYQGNPAHYFLNVANKIYLEHSRKPKSVELPDNLTWFNEEEKDFQPHFECLKKCLTTLPTEKRNLIINYYEEEKKAKINSHKQLAETNGIEVVKLHSLVFRLRTRLQKCVLECVEKKDW
jgi:RNA polymerase sigma factor (sigma-70 family)